MNQFQQNNDKKWQISHHLEQKLKALKMWLLPKKQVVSLTDLRACTYKSLQLFQSFWFIPKIFYINTEKTQFIVYFLTISKLKTAKGSLFYACAC